MRIGILGAKGSGKDTTFDRLLAKLSEMGIPINRFAFADSLKQMVSQFLGIPLDILHDPVLKEVPYTKPLTYDIDALVRDHRLDSVFIKSGLPDASEKFIQAINTFVANIDKRDTRPRRFLQDFAETIRRMVSPNFWVWIVEPQLDALPSTTIAVMTDVREMEEVDMVMRGSPSLTLKVVRPTTVYDAHKSERLAETYDCDITIQNDDTVGTLYCRVDEIIDDVVRLYRQIQ